MYLLNILTALTACSLAARRLCSCAFGSAVPFCLCWRRWFTVFVLVLLNILLAQWVLAVDCTPNPANACWRFNPDTGKKDYFEKYSSPTIPHFLATLPSPTILTQNIYYVLPFTTADDDNMGWFDLLGDVQQYAYIPQQEGFYDFYAQMCSNCTTSFSYDDVNIQKNSVRLADNDTALSLAGTFFGGTSCKTVNHPLIYMNGTTDYVQAFTFVKGTGCQISALPYDTFFSGHLVTKLAREDARVRETFNRLNSSITTNSTHWANVPGANNLKMVSNVVIGTTASVINADYWQDRLFTDDQCSMVTMVTTTSNKGPIVRASSLDTTFYRFTNNGPTSYQYWKTISGVETKLGTDISVAPQANDILTLCVAGSTLTAYVNGTPQTTRTDGDISSGSPGLYIYGNDANGQLDNWSGWSGIYHPW